MIICGRVEGKIIVADNTVMYNVLQGQEKHHVRSVGRQAAKDAIFLREGQSIEVQGSTEDKMLLAQESKIDIRRIKSGE
ncbi:hypothetical protein SAMN04487770_1651 [Butyrivibrio sp. ob235]|uniref:hypothetical protein n=1 Tax=Butyrivibrio sp. ob235 TaxID=1761780 RepID=UPI0008D08631|nr:hypothetical protein [Butyrivibrio sp. ob235]SEM68232.1 hypothetical protein SAMN04487770_1651 [Butyrivibrio sp. ob235]